MTGKVEVCNYSSLIGFIQIYYSNMHVIQLGVHVLFHIQMMPDGNPVFNQNAEMQI